MIKNTLNCIKIINNEINSAQISSEDKTRYQHYSIFLLVGIPAMVVFGISNLLQGNFTLFSLVVFSATGLITGWYHLKKIKNSKIIYRINIFIFSLLIIYMIGSGGEGGSKILWMYILPLISFFLFNKREGLFWTNLVLLSAIIIFWNPANWQSVYIYPNDFIIRFITTFIMVSAISYWFEHFRSQYRNELEFKNETLEKEIVERKKAEKEKEKLINELQEALDEVKILSGFIPICASCKNIRDDKGYWNQIESYLKDHSNAEFSHSLCPDCAVKLYPQYFGKDKKNKI